MTTRAIKKLTKKDDLKLMKEKLSKNEADEDEEVSEEEEIFVPKNKFDLVNHKKIKSELNFFVS
jgi:hypothetical protein